MNQCGFVIHMCMEGTLGISLHNYLSQTSKNVMSFLLFLIFSLQQNWRTRGWNRFCPEEGVGVRVGGGPNKV
jgi:hypothetical protein